MKPLLRIAIVHYHLCPGGVARVIERAWRALRETTCRVVVLTGVLPSAAWPPECDVRLVQGLAYTQRPLAQRAPERLAEDLLAVARRALGGLPDIWHFHNHGLGKNAALSLAAYHLAQAGHRLLLQIHDFPEDGRPANYRNLARQFGSARSADVARILYPVASHVHYAVLNGRDRDFLCRSGMARRHVHLLPNAVDLPASVGQDESSGTELFLYPTRAIRRKNLGEFLLWAACAEGAQRFATTLAPASAADLPGYRRWVHLAEGLGLPVDFEVGRFDRRPFSELLASAKAVISTSVAEGFGLAFLEPWLMRRPLLGRDLPEITCDFKKHKISLPDLYERLLIPPDWINAKILKQKISAAWCAQLAAYGRAARPAAAQVAFRAAWHDGRIDFGRMDEALQAKVVRRLAGSRAMRSELIPRVFASGANMRIVLHNRTVVKRLYASEGYRRQLQQIYRILAAQTVGQLTSISGDKLLNQFLAPERFYLLRT